MTYNANNVEQYLELIPIERKESVQKLRDIILKNLPKGFVEVVGYGMPSYVVPHSIFPDGYHCDPKLPLPFMSFASHKNFVAFHHMGIYANPKLMEWFVDEYPKYSKLKLDMGKSCIRFKKINEIPYQLIGELVSKVTVEEWIQLYKQTFIK